MRLDMKNEMMAMLRDDLKKRLASVGEDEILTSMQHLEECETIIAEIRKEMDEIEGLE